MITIGDYQRKLIKLKKALCSQDSNRFLLGYGSRYGQCGYDRRFGQSRLCSPQARCLCYLMAQMKIMAANAINYAARYADILCCSWGGSQDSRTAMKIRKVINKYFFFNTPRGLLTAQDAG